MKIKWTLGLTMIAVLVASGVFAANLATSSLARFDNGPQVTFAAAGDPLEAVARAHAEGTGSGCPYLSERSGRVHLPDSGKGLCPRTSISKGEKIADAEKRCPFSRQPTLRDSGSGDEESPAVEIPVKRIVDRSLHV